MSHRQRETHIAHLYHEVATGGANRDGSEQTEWQEYASVDVRLTDIGGSFGQTVAGERDVELPILTGPGWLIEAGIDEGQRLAIDGAGFDYNATAPGDGDWFEVTQVSMLFGRGRSPRGVEMEITQVS